MRKRRGKSRFLRLACLCRSEEPLFRGPTRVPGRNRSLRLPPAFSAIQVMNFACFKQARGGRFGSEVPLRRGEQFVSDHELSNGGGTEQRREIVCVQMPCFVGLAVSRALMETHRIRKRGLKKVVVTGGDLAKNGSQELALVFVQLLQ